MNVTGNQHKTTKADPAPAHRARAPPPPFENFKGCIFEIFDRLQNTHKLYCNQYAMFTICTLFSTITIKA